MGAAQKKYDLSDVFDLVKSTDPSHRKNEYVDVNKFFEHAGFKHEVLPHYEQDCSFRSVCNLIQGNFQFNLKRVPPMMREKVQLEIFCSFVL